MHIRMFLNPLNTCVAFSPWIHALIHGEPENWLFVFHFLKEQPDLHNDTCCNQCVNNSPSSVHCQKTLIFLYPSSDRPFYNLIIFTFFNLKPWLQLKDANEKNPKGELLLKVIAAGVNSRRQSGEIIIRKCFNNLLV